MPQTARLSLARLVGGPMKPSVVILALVALALYTAGSASAMMWYRQGGAAAIIPCDLTVDGGVFLGCHFLTASSSSSRTPWYPDSSAVWTSPAIIVDAAGNALLA